MAALATPVIGFLWHSLLFARPWMVLMRCDPDDRAKLREMQKGAGPMYAPPRVASLLAQSRYSVIKPPVRSASREMSCSTHQFWSSSTIFSVEHGSQ